MEHLQTFAQTGLEGLESGRCMIQNHIFGQPDAVCDGAMESR